MKDITIQREIRITLMRDMRQARVAFQRGSKASVPLPYLDAFDHQGLAQFVHETKMVGRLVRDIGLNTSVRDRWVPKFIDSLAQIEEVLNSPRHYVNREPSKMGSVKISRSPTTIGPHLAVAMCERMRRRINTGLSLRVIIYALSLIARFAMDGDKTSLSSLIVSIVVWIVEDTCDDCLVKLMRLRANAFKYSFHLNDSFSPYIKFPLSSTLNIDYRTDCASRAIVDSLRRHSLRTIGSHAFLISPEANKRVATKISFTAGYPEVTLYPTYRQSVSLMSILDLHARVMRAHNWNSSVRAFNAWFSERVWI